MIYQSNNVDETKAISSVILKKYIKSARVFALQGPLGAGKTTFVQGFARALGVDDKITSPTFVLIKEHIIPNIGKKLYHIDLYRVENTLNLGLEEIFQDPRSIVLIEWPERLTQKLPEDTVKIEIKITSENTRDIIVE